MTPYYADAWLTVYAGDCRAVLAEMPAQSVHCVVTSPPYWGLRDYGTEGQIGLEPTPEAYVETMVAVFREVRRVLRDDGTVWLNLGDSYASGEVGRHDNGSLPSSGPAMTGLQKPRSERRVAQRTGLKPKDLVGIPWRTAFALQADGWYLRSDVVWSKPNPMPESVTDRPTKSHEYVFLLSKRERYYFDADAVREAVAEGTAERYAAGFSNSYHDGNSPGGRFKGPAGFGTHAPAGRNIRSVWHIATQPYPGAHFATFPEALVEPCVKAGTSERGVCPDHGAPWVRLTRREGGERYATGKSAEKNGAGLATAFSGYTDGSSAPTFVTLDWCPSCGHDAESVPATVLDPFAGSGTTGRVAQRLGRRAVLIDLNPAYLVQAMVRNRDIPLGLGFGPTEDAA
jgi:DNA modification methylase